MMIPRYSSEIIKYHIETLLSLGLTVDEVDRETGLDSRRLLSDAAYFRRKQFDVYRIIKLLHETDYHKEREILDTVKMVGSPSSYNAYLLNSPSISDLFEKICEFCELCYPDNAFEWRDGGEQVVLYFDQNEREREFSTPQGFLIYVIRMVYEYYNDESVEIEVGTTSSGFPDYERFLQYATDNVTFNAERTYIKIPKYTCAQGTLAYNPKVASFIRNQFFNSFPEVPEDQALPELIAEDIRGAMREGGDGRSFNVDFMSKRHGVSRATLYRRLQQAGTSFTSIVDGLRKEKSKELLGDPMVTISEVSRRLGYSSTSAFDRAFFRWFEVSPTSYRDARKNR